MRSRVRRRSLSVSRTVRRASCSRATTFVSLDRRTAPFVPCSGIPDLLGSSRTDLAARRVPAQDWLLNRTFGLGAFDLLHHFEAHQRRAVRDRAAAVLGGLRVPARERRALDPRAEGVLALPARVDEVARLPLDGPQQLEAL